MKRPLILDLAAGALVIIGLQAMAINEEICTPPSITAPPADLVKCERESATFTVVAAGTAPLTYQWQRYVSGAWYDLHDGDEGTISGATTATLTISAVVATDAAHYHVVVNNSCGETGVSGRAPLLTVNVPPSITTPPANQTVCPGESVTVQVAATGTGPLSYAWTHDGVGLPGQTESSLNLASVSSADAGVYEVTVTGPCGSVVRSAMLTVTLSITGPFNAASCAGESVTFKAWVTGTGLSYVWRFNGAVIPGQTGSSLTLDNVGVAQAGTYSVTATGSCGSVASAATLTVCDSAVDSDADGLPDCWEMKHFGTLARDASDDYDEDGKTNGEEYGAGSDPNTIVASLQLPKLWASSQTVAGTFEVLRGVPAQMAILVDNTDFANASWKTYNSSFTANLGTTDGAHKVWVGLRGRAQSSEQSWNCIHIVRDRLPPLLAVTNPVPASVSIPMIQLQGYCLEPLASLKFDVVNGAGTQTDQLGFVSGQFYDTNLHTYTTNYFQCYDIKLTTGVNTVTLRATDLAGNVTVTNFVVRLATDTTAPTINLGWPQDQTKLCGSSFTVNGSVDDPTATVTLELVDNGNNTSRFAGVVERSGRFWVEDLPLGAGTSHVTLTAADAWGNSRNSSTITVVKTDFALTVDPVSPDQLCTPALTVTGTVGDSSYTLWVNGKQATVEYGYYWQADNVPVTPGGTASFNVTAYPPGHNPLPNPSDPTRNPFDSAAPTIQMNVEKPERLYVKSRSLGFTHLNHRILTEDHPLGPGEGQIDEDHSDYWADGEGGNGENLYIVANTGYPTSQCLQEFQWPPTLWPELTYATVVKTPWNGDGRINASAPPFIVRGTGGDQLDPIIHPVYENAGTMTHCDIASNKFDQYFYDDYGYSGDPGSPDWYNDWIHTECSWHVETKLSLYTGRKAVPHRMNLFMLTGSATEVTEKATPPIYGITSYEPIPSTRIKIGELGELGEDGRLYVVLPDDVTKDVTLSVTDVPYYIFSISASKLPNVDLDVDSDNQNGLERSQHEDDIEEQPPGKYLAVNDGDADGDGIPDFADGYDLFGTPDQGGQSAPFTPLALEIPSAVDLTRAKVKFVYQASPPGSVTRTSNPDGSYTYTPAPGGLRIWANDGGQFRKKAQIDHYIDDGHGHRIHDGDYVASDTVYWATNVTSLYIEGIRNGTYSNTVLLDPNGESGFIASDTVVVSVVKVDLDVDSDNNNGQYGGPNRTDYEDQIEDEKPGKWICANIGDADNDGVPNFADGFDNWGNAGANAGGRFTPLVVEFPAPLDLSRIKVRFTYTASDPNNVTRTGTPPGPYVYGPDPSGGHVRVWNVDGSVDRMMAEVSASGNYVKPGSVYTPANLGAGRMPPLYVEGVTESTSPDGEEITVEVDPLGSDPPVWVCVDKVRCTVVKVDLDVDTNRDAQIDDTDESGEDTWSEGPNSKGAIVLPNLDDDNNDGVPDNWTGGDWHLNGGNVPASTTVDADPDKDDLAPLWGHKLGLDPLPDNFVITLKVSKPSGESSFFASVNPERRIRIFLPSKVVGNDYEIQANDNAIIGPEKGAEAKFVKTPGANEYASSIFAGSGVVKFGVEGIEVGAMVDIEMSVLQGTTVLGSQKVRIRVAPFVLLDHTLGVSAADKTVFVEDLTPLGFDNSDLRTKLSANYGAHLDVTSTGDPWHQDGYEVGYVKAPYGSMWVVLSLPRGSEYSNALYKYVHNALLKPGVGVCTRVESSTYGAQDDGGNLECIPVANAPGKFFHGDLMAGGITDFFAAQGVNAELAVNTSWLAVGHVDEVVSPAPDGNKFLVAAPEVCWALLVWANSIDPAAVMLQGMNGIPGGVTVNSVVTSTDLKSFNCGTAL